MSTAFGVFGILCAIIAEMAGDIPNCDYFDTVNLTNSLKFTNGSYRYEDIIIPKEKVGQYNYQISYDGEREPVLEHTRGCACQIKSCVRFCCHPQKLLIYKEQRCGDVISNLSYNSVLKITTNDGLEIEKNISEFVVQRHLPVPCSAHIALDPSDKNNAWTLFEVKALNTYFLQ